MPDFPADVNAFTVRLRKAGDRHRMVFAPAGGLGWSKPCCEVGHLGGHEAVQHGAEVLQFLFSRQSQPATLS